MTTYLYFQPEIQAQLKCIHKPLQQITVIDVPFCQHPVIKFLVTDSSLASRMVDKLCSVYGGVCFGVPTVWHWVNHFKIPTLISLICKTDIYQECEGCNAVSTSTSDQERDYITAEHIQCHAGDDF